MAGLDLGTASRYFHQLHRPDLHLQHQPEPEEQEASNNRVGGHYGSADHHQDDGSRQALDLVNAGNSGAGDLVARRPRGRPPGSKNKPKPPVIITRESANTLRAHILEVGNGCDVFDCIANYARRKAVRVTNVSIRQPAIWKYYHFRCSFLPPPAPPGCYQLDESIWMAKLAAAGRRRSGGGNNMFGDGGSGAGGLPFLNLPLNMPPNVQLPVEGWPGNSGGRPPF
ncbi:hypothetical protein GOBAR_AA04486 [Gossypium barbadense]|uniref:AT-hook motif nuclear-localized protein n=1 Tax=Gossypium barbadense TaxID=3634 RepID=A0A2P5YKQ3_GOSBA|nr:hypothetical protein GOBAR_AA04486 [Gossypium barbadense]